MRPLDPYGYRDPQYWDTGDIFTKAGHSRRPSSVTQRYPGRAVRQEEERDGEAVGPCHYL